jgi:hypothetical protein
MERPKAHHYIPAAHLARFSVDPPSVPARRRTVAVYSKRDAGFRRAKAEKLAFENDLYTFRIPDMSGVQPDPDQLVRAVFDPANKDAELEAAKADIELAGLEAMREVEKWEVGPRVLTEDERQPLLSYAGLLLAQHPTMMAARSDALATAFWSAVGDRVVRDPILETLTDEMNRGSGAMAVVFDGLATALELNYLAWKVVRWPEGPRIILGDTGVSAWFPGQVLGIGHPWSSGAKFMLPISPSSIVIFGEVIPGAAFVEERTNDPAEIGAQNVISWARARSEVYASDFDDLKAVMRTLGPLGPRSDHSTQLEVRQSVLPTFKLDHRGDLKIVQPKSPDGDETRLRFEARFPDFQWSE